MVSARSESVGATPRPGQHDALKIRLGDELGPITVVADQHLAKAYAFAQDDYGWLRCPDGARQQLPTLVLANRLLRVYEERYERHANHGALHTRQELWYHGPLFVDDTVTISGRYVDAYHRRDRTYLVLESTAVDSRGDLLVTSRSTEAMPAAMRVEVVGAPSPTACPAHEHVTARRGPVVPGDDGPELTESSAPVPLRVGTALPVLRKTIEPDQMAVYSGAGQYERNFHTDLEKAREAGLPRPIAQAMQTACHIGEWLASLFGPQWTRTGWQDSRFLAPVLAGDRVTVGGRVAAVEPHPDGARAELEVWVRTGSGLTTAVGHAVGVTDR